MTPALKPRLPQTLALMVVDDHPLIRQGVRSLVGTAVEELRFIEASSGEEARERLRAETPDLLIVDVVLPDVHGLDLVRELRAGGVAVPIIALSMHGEAAYAERALRAGASSYVMKEEVGTALLEAVERVLEGEVHLSPQVARRIAAKMRGGEAGGASVVDLLTDREMEVWRQLGSGLSTRRIAAELEISPKTVETHCFNIRRKTGIANMTELVHSATRWLHGSPGTA